MIKINTTSRMYQEINEVIRKNDGFTKEEFYRTDKDGKFSTFDINENESVKIGIDPERMMITDYSPDSPSWSGKVCVVFGGEVNFITILIKDSEHNKFYNDGNWRIFSQQEIIEDE